MNAGSGSGIVRLELLARNMRAAAPERVIFAG
jgi:hypothetical protein